MSDIKQQFSLDYLSDHTPRVNAGESTVMSPLDEAVILYSQPIIKHLRAAGGQMRVHDLVEAAGTEIGNVKFEEFLGVCERLSSLGFVEVVERSPIGNHLVRLLKS